LMRDLGRTKPALDCFRDAVTILKMLAGRFEEEPRYRQHLARGYLNLGTALRDAKQFEEARTSYKQAITIFTTLTGRWPRVADYRHELAIARNNLGNLLADPNRLGEPQWFNGLWTDWLANWHAGRIRLQEALAEHDEARK